MPNSWITHVKEYASKNNVSYKEAMSKSKASYKTGDVNTKKEIENISPLKKKKIKIVNKGPLKKKVIKINKPYVSPKYTDKQRLKKNRTIEILDQLKEIRDSVPINNNPLKLRDFEAQIYQQRILKPFLKIWGKVGIMGDTKEEREINLPIYLQDYIYQFNNYIDVKIWLLLLNDKDDTYEIDKLKSYYIRPHIYKMQFKGDESIDPTYTIPENLNEVY